MSLLTRLECCNEMIEAKHAWAQHKPTTMLSIRVFDFQLLTFGDELKQTSSNLQYLNGFPFEDR